MNDAASKLSVVEAIQSVQPNWPPLENQEAPPPTPAMPAQAAVVPFDREDGEDDAGSLREACRSLEKLEWDINDLQFFFNRAETRMKVAGVKKNYTKFQVLSEILPKKVQDQVKPILRLTEEEFPNKDGYLQLKKAVLRIFGPKPEAAIARAFSRVLVDLPSALARDLVNDLCKCQPQLSCACCTPIIAFLWKRNLSSTVRAGIAHQTFNRANFEEILQLADDIHTDTNPASATVAAVSPLDETQPAIPYPTAEVAAIRGNNRGGRSRGRGGRNSRSGGARGRGSGQGAGGGRGDRGPRHPDGPPDQCCKLHWKFGKSANFCVEPGTCPWKDIFTPKSKSNQ